MATESDTGDGTRLLTSIDLYEISLTATPMHPAARVVSWKSTDDELTTEADQRRRMARLMMTPEQARDLDRWLGVLNESIGGTNATAPATKSKGPIRIARFPVE
jgi:hypothetical protein